jgi:hypothetical protein
MFLLNCRAPLKNVLRMAGLVENMLDEMERYA